MTIGERIKNRRIEAGLSVEDLASKLGKNRATIYRYENGDIGNLPISILEPIAKVLCTTPAYLMGYETNLETNTDFIAELMQDSDMIEHIKSLLSLDAQDRKSVYDMIEFLLKKKGL
ncbi:anaerobic benzoate catabolism transcriptional regulator [uncultured Eubacterium sp.]|nr:anaerobic benzoate catabolism transcriptional regulator [uncultured Eubacterium sp.]